MRVGKQLLAAKKPNMEKAFASLNKSQLTVLLLVGSDEGRAGVGEDDDGRGRWEMKVASEDGLRECKVKVKREDGK